MGKTLSEPESRSRIHYNGDNDLPFSATRRIFQVTYLRRCNPTNVTCLFPSVPDWLTDLAQTEMMDCSAEDESCLYEVLHALGDIGTIE